MGRLIHFEIHAENPDRAVKFYSELFGWKFTNWGGPMEYWLVETGDAAAPGINGGLLRRQGPPPTSGQAVNAFVCTIDVTNVDSLVAQAPASGGEVALPKMPVPGVGWLAYLKDTEGNIFGIMQHDPAAA
jgi:predicted enzyme related to lactoylglutathione lyase